MLLCRIVAQGLQTLCVTTTTTAATTNTAAATNLL